MISGLLTWWRRITAPSTMPPPEADMLGAATLPAEPLVTAEMLDRLGWVKAFLYAPHLSAACATYHITTPRRLAAFLAQVGHESGGGKWRRELASGEAYEGRRDLGNTQPGDGTRFRGRGMIQITGRANTTRARDVLRPGMDLDAFCAWLETTEGACVSAAWWWLAHGCNDIADRGEFERLTRRINGGLNGYKDRVERWEAAKQMLGVT